MKLDQLATIIAIMVGLYGIIHTTYLLIRGSLKERRKVKVMCEAVNESWAETIKQDSVYSVALRQLHPTTLVLRIMAINNSPEPIVLAAVGFYLSNREKIEPEIDDIFPQKIEGGGSAYFVFRITKLQELISEKVDEPIVSKFIKGIRSFGRTKQTDLSIYDSPVAEAKPEIEYHIKDGHPEDIYEAIEYLRKEELPKNLASNHQDLKLQKGRRKQDKVIHQFKKTSSILRKIIYFPIYLFRNLKWLFASAEKKRLYERHLVEERLARYLDEEDTQSRELEKSIEYRLKHRVFLTNAFVRDIAGHEYSSPVPQLLEHFGLKKRKTKLVAE